MTPSLCDSHCSPPHAASPLKATLLWNTGLTHLTDVHSIHGLWYVLAMKWCLVRCYRDCEQEPISQLSWKPNFQLRPFQSTRCLFSSQWVPFFLNISLFPPLWSSYPTLKQLSQKRPDIPIYVGDTERPVFWNLDQSGVRLTNINVVSFGLWQQVSDLFYYVFWGDI